MSEKLTNIETNSDADSEYTSLSPSEASELAVKGLAKAIRTAHPDKTSVRLHLNSSILPPFSGAKANKKSPPPQSIEENERLSQWNAEDERLEYSEQNRSFEIFPLPERIKARYDFLNELPRNMAVMGGMARSIAREIITGDREPIRDIDLVNILGPDGEDLNDAQTLDKLAKAYMPDDYAFGHGIQNDTLEKYFQSRDFTVNEALVMNGALIVSNFAYNDFQENIIRPTYHEKHYSSTRLGSRITLRAIMMQTVLSECTSSYPTIEDMEINGDYLGNFDIAVNLNKAMSRGAETAQRFTEFLSEYDAIPAEFAGRPVALAKYWRKYRVSDFEFRLNNDKRVSVTKKNSMLDYYASDPAIRKALAEYDDYDTDERYHGCYTQDEFDEINQQEYDWDYEEETSYDDDGDEWEDWEDDYEDEDDYDYEEDDEDSEDYDYSEDDYYEEDEEYEDGN